MTAESTYYFKIYPYTNSGSAINFKIDGTPPSANATTDPMPEAPDILISEVADPSDVANAKFVELYNASGSEITFDSGLYLCRQSNGGSWADVVLVGTISSGGTFVIGYNQTTYEATYLSSADQYSGSISGNGNDGYFLYYGSGHETGTLIDAYGVIDVDGTGEDWEYTDSHAVRNAGVTEPNDTWTASEWTITSATAAQCTPGISTLPVTLSTFTAQYLNSKPTLYWQTQSEEDNMGWFIYRNTTEDFTSAEKITDMIEGHGTTSQPQSYIYEDAVELQFEQTYYYWLESVDYSGTIHHYDKVAQVTIPHQNDPGQNVTPPVAYEITADPNPFSYTTNISFVMDQPSLVDVAIYNVKGQLVKSFNFVMTSQENETVAFLWNGKNDAGKLLSNGVYLYLVKVDGKDYATKQLILMK
ncbi:T9SS C-terminal target domain-containing protein [bacterium]|nr:MAG: T9SS C-terminal target domain-containing protein [bacterium]